MHDLTTRTDAPLEALMRPLRDGTVALPDGPALFLGARAGDWLHLHGHASWRCEQPFLPLADALREGGIATQARIEDTGFALVLALPPRQREAARALLARAVRATDAGGTVLVAASNTEGARSLETDLRALAGAVQSQSKHKCRVAWARIDPASIDPRLLLEWLALDAPREVQDAGERFHTRPGLFAWDRVDAASALLADCLPSTLAGRAADLGAGWGYLALQLLRRCPGIQSIDLFEANALALEPARHNLAATLAGRDAPICTVHWHDVTRGLPGRYDVIVSNPPFHIDRADLPQLGRAFLRVAADALADDGQAWIVANRHLPYETLLGERFAQVEHIALRDGFKLIHATRPKR